MRTHALHCRLSCLELMQAYVMQTLLRKAISKAGSQMALAKRLRVNPRTVRRWVAGTKPKGLYGESLKRFAKDQ